MKDELVRVMEVPKSDGQFRFGGGAIQRWVEVDWFRSLPPGGFEHMTDDEIKASIVEFVREKNYTRPGIQYLVLAETWAETWTEQAREEVG